jgi:hypothetical protein
MSDTKNHDEPQGAKLFGETNFFEARMLENESKNANGLHLAQAAKYLEGIFEDKHAWCGGYALHLRGSARRTEDLDIVIQASSPVEIWDTLLSYDRLVY